MRHRAFIAASRRKDRSLDARVESAQRASALHQKRTGRALYITREIVESEAMYEEVDDRYLEKRTHMLQIQNLHIEAEFKRHLLETFKKEEQRAARMTTSTPVSPSAPMGNGKNVNLHLSDLPSPFSDAGGMNNFVPNNGYQLSPTGTFSPSSYMPSLSPGAFPNVGATPQIPAYVAQQTPTWQTQATPQQPVWTPHPVQTNMQSAMWQQQTAPYPQFATEAAMQSPQIRPRHRQQSAPELHVYGVQPVSGPPPTHTRVNSEPNLSVHRVANIQQASGNSTPGSEACFTPTTPAQEPDMLQMGLANTKAGEMTLPNEEATPGLHDFSQYTMETGNDVPSKVLEPFDMEEYLTWEAFPPVS